VESSGTGRRSPVEERSIGAEKSVAPCGRVDVPSLYTGKEVIRIVIDYRTREVVAA
jgi:hypothetical protein